MLRKLFGASLLPLAMVGLAAPAAGAPAAPEESVFEEIVVTATKRERSLQDVNIAVTAFSGDDIDKLRFNEAADIAVQTPNLTAVNVFGNNLPNFAIRGIGLNDIAPNNSSPVAVHVDEVYMAYGIMLNFALFDVERVEVLKGPQGTLYGRNTTAGAVNFFTRKPTKEFEAGATVGYGNYENLEFEGYASGPLSDKVSVRLSGLMRRQWSGPYYNRFLDTKHGEVDRYAWRAQVAIEPNENLDINISVHGGEDDSDLAQYNMLPTGNADFTDFCPAYLNGTLQGGEPDCFGAPAGEQEPDSDPFTGAPGFRPFMHLDGIGGVATINWDIDNVTLTSVSGFEKIDRYIGEDADGFPIVNVDGYYENDAKQFTQELRLASNDDAPLQWIVGAYWLSDKLNAPRTEVKAFERGIGVIVASEQETDTAAGFGQLEWQVSDLIKLTGGLRYTWEKRKYSASTDLTTGDPDDRTDAPAPINLGRLASKAGDISFKDLSGKIGIDITPDDDQLYYASVSKGFKSGGFNGNLAFSDDEINEYGDETIWAYEAGAKFTLLDGRLIWNTAAFYYDYKDVQAIGNFLTKIGGLDVNLFTLANLSDGEVLGLESDVWLRPTSGLDVKFGVGLLDTKFKNATEGNESLNGNEFQNAPNFNANGLVRYFTELTPSLGGTVQVDFNYQGHYFTDIENEAAGKVGDYVLVNGRLAVGDLDDRWEVALWGKNLFDKKYTPYVNILNSTYRVLRSVGAPRTYGIELKYRFN